MNRIRGARRRWIAPVLAGAMYLGFAFVTHADASSTPRASLEWSRVRPDVVVGVATTERVVALSFDDGPDPRWTPAVLDALDRYGAKATFFMEGDHVAEHQELARDVVRRGHEAANHTYDHPELPALDGPTVLDQVVRANAAFSSAGLPPPTLFRPPKGRFDLESAAAVRATGLLTVGWTNGMCIEKWTRSHAPADGMALLLEGVRPGAILLGHDGGVPDRSATVAALPALLEGLRARGYRVVTVSELLALTAPPRDGRGGDAR